MSRFRLALPLAAALVALLAGCASNESGSAYSRAQTRGEMSVRLGVVESVRQVTIDGSRSGVGTIAGGAIGGIAGAEIGHGRGSTVGSILGAVAGGVAGNVLEEKMSKKNGLEITIRLEDGRLTAITQEADEEFRPGERVRILSGNGVTRVSH